MGLAPFGARHEAGRQHFSRALGWFQRGWI